MKRNLNKLWLAIRRLHIAEKESISDSVDTAVIAQQTFSDEAQKKDVINYLETLLGKHGFCSRHINIITAATSVTIECYWRRYADAYAEHIVACCEEYQKAMNGS